MNGVAWTNNFRGSSAAPARWAAGSFRVAVAPTGHSSPAKECPVGATATLRIIFCAVLAFIAIAAPIASAQSTQPSYDKSAAQALENQPLNFNPDTVRMAVPHPTGAAATGAGSDLSRMILGLIAVVGVILLMRWGARRMSLVPGATRSGAVKVISRSIMSPRQQVLVLQVGKRLVVVGDSAGQMHPLCEITDPDEVAAMIGGSRQEASALAARSPRSFTSLLRRAAQPFEADTAELPARVDEPLQNVELVSNADNEDVGSLLDKVRVLRQQFRQTGS